MEKLCKNLAKLQVPSDVDLMTNTFVFDLKNHNVRYGYGDVDSVMQYLDQCRLAEHFTKLVIYVNFIKYQNVRLWVYEGGI